MTKITEKRRWLADDVRNVCIRNDLYTRGTNEAYAKMLEKVAQTEPSNDALFDIATDIVNHSDEQTVSNVMFLLINHAVRISFEIEE